MQIFVIPQLLKRKRKAHYIFKTLRGGGGGISYIKCYLVHFNIQAKKGYDQISMNDLKWIDKN